MFLDSRNTEYFNDAINKEYKLVYREIINGKLYDTSKCEVFCQIKKQKN